MEELKIAKMMIYGWIKDWSCLTLMQAIKGDSKVNMAYVNHMCEKYPFLPSHVSWYYLSNGKGVSKYIKKYIADADRRLNDALWDTEDNMKKLDLAHKLLKLNGNKLQPKSRFSNADRQEMRKSRKEYQAKQMEYSAVKEYAQKMNGTHWGTVK
jgi:hypothetical protein